MQHINVEFRVKDTQLWKNLNSWSGTFWVTVQFLFLSLVGYLDHVVGDGYWVVKKPFEINSIRFFTGSKEDPGSSRIRIIIVGDLLFWIRICTVGADPDLKRDDNFDIFYSFSLRFILFQN